MTAIFTTDGLRRGARMALPLAVASIAFGLGFGVLALETGLTLAQALAMSGLVFAGASQMVAMDAWADPPAVIGLTILAATINIRHIVMGAAMRPWIQSLPLLRSHAALSFMTDANWAMAMAERRRGEADVAILVGSGMVMWLGWVGGTGLGHALGAAIGDPRAYGIDVIVPAFFALMLAPLWPGWRACAPWVLAVIVALVVHRFVPGTWYAVAGGLAGAVFGGWLDGRARRRAGTSEAAADDGRA